MAVIATSSTVETISEIVSGGRRFVFTQPLEIEVTCQNGVWAFDSQESIGVYDYGLSRQEAFENFCVFFEAQWDNLAREPDRKLARLPAAWRTRLLRIVDRVETA